MDCGALARRAFVAAILLALAIPAWTQTTSPLSVVFVPYDKSKGPRLGSEDSVLLPYAEFLKLRSSARKPDEIPGFQPAASVAQAVYTGTIEGDVALLDAEFAVEVIARPKDILEITLPFRGASPERCDVQGPGASVSPLGDSAGLKLRMQGDGRRTVKLSLAVPLQSRGPVRVLDFAGPRAAAASLRLRSKDEVIVEKQANSLPAVVTKAEGGGSEIRVSVGASEQMVLAFRTTSEEQAVAETRISSSQEMGLTIGTGPVQAQAKLQIGRLSGSVDRVALSVPPGVQVLSVTGAYVRDWNRSGDDKGVSITLTRALKEGFDLSLDMKLDSPTSLSQVVVPEVRVQGAVRESGSIKVTAGDGISLWPERWDGLQAGSAPAGEKPGVREYRFSEPGWKLSFSRQPTPARMRTQGLLLYEVTEELVRLKSRHDITVAGQGIVGVQFHVPPGYELRDARPPEVVAGYRQSGNVVEVNLKSEHRGSLQLDLSLQRARAAGEGRVELLPISVGGAEEDAGHLVLATPAALRATEASSSGLQATDVRTLAERVRPLLSQDIEPAFGYRYFSPRFNVAAGIERQRTRLTCDTSLLASLTPSLMKIDATLSYNVEFSAADEFQFLLPASAGEEVRFSGADIKEKVRSGADSATTASSTLTTWTVRLQKRVLGAYRLSVSFDTPLPQAEPGKPLSITVPSVRALGVARETGHIAVSRGENFEVRVASSEGLEQRDIRELPPSMANAFLGFRYYDPEKCRLELELVRHELAGVLTAVVRRMHMETVLSDQGDVVHEVIFEIQNNEEQYLALKLPAGMDIWAAFVRGAQVRPSTRQADGARLVELTKSQSKDDAFRVRLVLRSKLKSGAMKSIGWLHFDTPEVLKLNVLRFTRRLYLPQHYRYLKFEGPMWLDTAAVRPWIEPLAESALNDAPAKLAGGRQALGVDPGAVSESAGYNTAESDAEKQARIQGGALDVPVVKQGIPFDLSMLSGTGAVDVYYVKRRPLQLMQMAVALLVFLVLGGLGWGGRRGRIVTAATVVLFACASLATGLMGRLLLAAFAASLAALAVTALAYMNKARKATRAEEETRRARRDERMNRLYPQRTEPAPSPPAAEPPAQPDDQGTTKPQA